MRRGRRRGGLRPGATPRGRHLRLGVCVVADACNPIAWTRATWERVATDCGARCTNVEVVCSDAAEHRRRVETRPSTVASLRLPTWREVEERAYEPWTRPRVLVDTAGRTETQSVAELLARLGL